MIDVLSSPACAQPTPCACVAAADIDARVEQLAARISSVPKNQLFMQKMMVNQVTTVIMITVAPHRRAPLPSRHLTLCAPYLGVCVACRHWITWDWSQHSGSPLCLMASHATRRRGACAVVVRACVPVPDVHTPCRAHSCACVRDGECVGCGSSSAPKRLASSKRWRSATAGSPSPLTPANLQWHLSRACSSMCTLAECCQCQWLVCVCGACRSGCASDVYAFR